MFDPPRESVRDRSGGEKTVVLLQRGQHDRVYKSSRSERAQMFATSEIHRVPSRVEESRVCLEGCHFKCRRCNQSSGDDDLSRYCDPSRTPIVGTSSPRLCPSPLVSVTSKPRRAYVSSATSRHARSTDV